MKDSLLKNMDNFIKSFDEELDIIEKEIAILKNKKTNNLKEKFTKKLDIKKGDIIYNVTGIIKVDNIKFNICVNERGEKLSTYITFIGDKYKWVKGGYITRTKNKELGSLYSYSNLKKIDKNKII